MMNRTKNGRFIILDQGELQGKYTSRSDSDVVRSVITANTKRTRR